MNYLIRVKVAFQVNKQSCKLAPFELVVLVKVLSMI